MAAVPNPEVYAFFGHNSVEVEGGEVRQVTVPAGVVVVSFIEVGKPALEDIQTTFRKLCIKSSTNRDYAKWIKDPVRYARYLEQYFEDYSANGEEAKLHIAVGGTGHYHTTPEFRGHTFGAFPPPKPGDRALLTKSGIHTLMNLQNANAEAFQEIHERDDKRLFTKKEIMDMFQDATFPSTTELNAWLGTEDKRTLFGDDGWDELIAKDERFKVDTNKVFSLKPERKIFYQLACRSPDRGSRTSFTEARALSHARAESVAPNAAGFDIVEYNRATKAERDEFRSIAHSEGLTLKNKRLYIKKPSAAYHKALLDEQARKGINLRNNDGRNDNTILKKPVPVIPKQRPPPRNPALLKPFSSPTPTPPLPHVNTLKFTTTNSKQFLHNSGFMGGGKTKKHRKSKRRTFKK